MTSERRADHFRARHINMTAITLRSDDPVDRSGSAGKQLGTLEMVRESVLARPESGRRSPIGQLVSIANISRREHDGTYPNGKQFWGTAAHWSGRQEATLET